MYRNKQHYFKVIYLCVIVFLFGCNGGNNGDEQLLSGTGSIVFSIEWRHEPLIHIAEKSSFKSKIFQLSQLLFSPLSAEADMTNCENVQQVRAEVFDGDRKIAEGGPWACSEHKGTIQNVPTGSGRKVVVYGEISGGKILYRGNRTGITLTEGQTFNTGVILCYQNLAPIAEARSYQAVKEGDMVTLNGASSNDPDLNDGIASYRWTQTMGPSVTLSDVNSMQATFRVPSVSESTTLTFELTVKDYGGLEGRDNVSITVNSGLNVPEAEAGSYQTVSVGDTVKLDGLSSKPSDEIVSYQWSQAEGQEVSLSNKNTAQPTFIAPSVDKSTILTFQLTVQNDSGVQDTDTVRITVNPKITAPLDVIIDNPLDNTIYKSGERIDFSAVHVDNADYKWDFDDGETGTGSPSPHIYSNEGDYTVVLTVTDKDNRVGNASFTVRIDDNFKVPSPDSFLTFVPIPAGDFWMGPDPNDENEVRLYANMSGFQMQETEMTQGQWKIIMGSNPSYFNKCGDDCPVESASWHDVQKVIGRLNNADDIYKYDLPTEAQWEYACRAGSESKFYFGDDETELLNYAWYSTGSANRTHPVKKLEHNVWGLYDMHGNVEEWCKDADLKYSEDYDKYPVGNIGEWASVRGGHYFSSALKCQSNYRDNRLTEQKKIERGFRLVRTPK